MWPLCNMWHVTIQSIRLGLWLISVHQAWFEASKSLHGGKVLIVTAWINLFCRLLTHIQEHPTHWWTYCIQYFVVYMSIFRSHKYFSINSFILAFQPRDSVQSSGTRPGRACLCGQRWAPSRWPHTPVKETPTGLHKGCGSYTFVWDEKTKVK